MKKKLIIGGGIILLLVIVISTLILLWPIINKVQDVVVFPQEEENDYDKIIGNDDIGNEEKG